MLIDMHAHVIPDELAPSGSGPDGPRGLRVERAEGDQSARVLVSERMRFPTPSIWFSAERRLEAMDKDGVDMEVVSPMPALLDYSVEPLEGRELSRRVNEFVVRLCDAAPDRLLGLGMVALQGPEVATAQLSEIAESGLKGVEIASNVNGASLGEETYLEFFDEAARLGLAVFVHGLNPTMGSRMPRAAGASFAVGAEMTVAVASVVMSGLSEKCPDLRLAFSHGGGGFAAVLPRAHYFWGRTWNEEPPEKAPSDQEGNPVPSPSEQARHFYYDALMFDRRAMRMAIEILGPTRMLVGTDFPAMDREHPAGKTLRSMGLSDEVVEQITWTNCFSFLGMEAPKP